MKNKKIIIISMLVLTMFLYNKNVNAEEILYGDVDGNEIVDTADVSMLNQYLNDSHELDYNSQIRADVDRDNKLTLNDVKLIQKHLEGIIELPVIMGDVNEDGVVDEMDVTLFQKYFKGTVEFTEKQMIIGDLNVDNETDVMDETILQKYNVDKETVLPVIDGKPIVKDGEKPEQQEQNITQKEEEKETNPNTGNNLYLYIIGFLLVSGISIFGTYIYHKKLNK